MGHRCHDAFKASAISNDPKMHCTLSRKGPKSSKIESAGPVYVG